MFGFAFVCVVETVAMSVLLGDWPAVHAVVLFLDVYTVVFVVALHAASVVRPHVLDGGALRVRRAVHVDLRIPLERIASVRRELRMTHERADGRPAGGDAGVRVPFLPGVSTASEVVALLERGVREMKFFPAQAAGGTAYLRSLAGPLPRARFCPTGGIGAESAPDYLALPNVGCVGGSWMLPADAVAARDWDRIERLARAAAGLSAGARCR
ncbi:hypothetical protein SGRIM128S_08559 [Streptomyces griseomycini]